MYLIGESHVRIGDDPAEFSTQNAKIVENITSGGFFEASEVQEG